MTLQNLRVRALSPNSLKRQSVTSGPMPHVPRRPAAKAGVAGRRYCAGGVIGGLKANLIFLYIGIRFGLGLRRQLDRHYPQVR